MLYAIVPVANGTPDIDFNIAVPLESFQATETERYCKFLVGTEPQTTWQIITSAEFETAKPPAPEPIEPPETTEEKLTRLENQNLILMDALATTFEELLELRALVEGGTD